MTETDEDIIERLEKELDIEKPKEDEKAVPQKKEGYDDESSLTEAEYNKLEAKEKEKYGV